MKNTILIIEDNEEIRDNTAELLELSGYQVLTASNGKEGLSKLQTDDVHMVLCDIMMPELDGYGVLRAVQNIPRHKDLPFVFLTAKSERSDFRYAMDLGADDYLTKPFSGEELLRVITARLKKAADRETRKESTAVADFADKEISVEEALEQISNKSTKNLRPKDMLFMEGDTGTHVYYVRKGRLKLFKTNEWGKEYITEIISPGGFIGHLAIMGDGTHKNSSMALETSEITSVPQDVFIDMMKSNRGIAIHFVKMLSGDLTSSDEKLIKLAYNSARKRVAEALLYLCRQYNPANERTKSFPVNRENLSAIAGISPESVSRNLTDFKDEKLIVTEDGNVRIIDYNRLANLRS